MKKKIRGSGTVYRRGQVWWVKYWDHGLQRNESSKSADAQVARDLLKQKIAEVAAGCDLAPGRCTVADLCQLVIADYRHRRLRDTQHVAWRSEAHITRLLGRLRADKLTSGVVRHYVETRRQEGAQDATINRELAIVHRAFELAHDEDPPLVRRVPKIRKLEEYNARQGFLEPEQYDLLLKCLPQRLKALFVCAYHVGVRKGELRSLRVEQVDLAGKVIRIEATQTKGKQARTLPIYGDMEWWLRAQMLTAKPDCPWLFHNGRGRRLGAHLEGWRDACQQAGLPGLLFHDLRRSAVRNMTRAGVRDLEAMRITGHKTRSVFDRYNIVDEHDLQAAGGKMDRFFHERRRQRGAKLRRVK